MNANKTRRLVTHVVAPSLGALALVSIALGAGAIKPKKNKRADKHQMKSQMHGKMGGGDMAGMDKDMAKMMSMLQAKAPALGYLKAHKDVSNPQGLLGGPIHIHLSQKQGGVFVALPAKRRLDSRVFGTPDMPMMYGGTPGITGVPPSPMFRGVKDGKYDQLQKMTPFGDKFMVMGGADLEIDAVDATATDAATTEDSIKLKASWKDHDGNTYTVVCNKVLAHGLEFPTFGGVVTNHMLHGFTGLGTPLMPTEFTYFGFWGMGAVMKNGVVLDKPRLIHGMLTEYVRADKYKLAFDSEVNPIRKQFHLMVTPFMPDMETGHFKHVPVKTGMNMKMPNGMEMELPFWHVMFESVDEDASRS